MSILEYLDDIFNKPEKYRKFWVALATLLVSVLSTYVPDAQWLPLVIQALGALGVYAVPNVRSK